MPPAAPAPKTWRSTRSCSTAPTARARASCFATPVGGEVLVADRKLVGSAQVRKRSAFLQHGSILLDGSQEIVAAVSRTPQVASAATTLSAELGRRVTWYEVVEAVVQAWRDEGTSLAPLGVAGNLR